MKIITVGSYLCHLMALIWAMELLGGRESVHTVLAMDRNEGKKDDEKKQNHLENLRSSERKDKEEEKENEEKKPCENGIDKESQKKDDEEEHGSEPSAPKEEELENKEEELEEVKMESEDEEKEEPSGAVNKIKSAIRKLSCVDSMRRPSMMLGTEEKKEEGDGQETDGESLSSAFKPICCMEQKKIKEELEEGMNVSIPDGVTKEELDEDKEEDEEEKKEVEDDDRNNIVEGPELLTAAILGSDYKNIEKPTILINIWPLESKESEKVAKILSLELVDETKIMGSYYRIKVKGKGNEGLQLLVNKGAGDEVLKIKENQFKFVTEIRSEEIPKLKRKMSIKRSRTCQIPNVKMSAFDLDFPMEMVGEDEVDKKTHALLEERKKMNNPFKKYYYRYEKYGEVEDSTPSEKMTPESEMSSSMEKSGSSRGIGILMGEFSEEDMEEQEMLEEVLLAGETYYE